MADQQDMLLFERYYGEANEITERIALPRNNPFGNRTLTKTSV